LWASKIAIFTKAWSTTEPATAPAAPILKVFAPILAGAAALLAASYKVLKAVPAPALRKTISLKKAFLRLVSQANAPVPVLSRF